jgi:hypothetical protein
MKPKQREFPPLTPENERRRKISVPHAAYLKNLSLSTFKRRYAHLIEKASDRRDVCELGKVLDAS